MISRIFGKKKAVSQSPTGPTEQPPANDALLKSDDQDQVATELALAKGLLPNDRWHVRGDHAVCIGSRVHVLPIGR